MSITTFDVDDDIEVVGKKDGPGKPGKGQPGSGKSGKGQPGKGKGKPGGGGGGEPGDEDPEEGGDEDGDGEPDPENELDRNTDKHGAGDDIEDDDVDTDGIDEDKIEQHTKKVSNNAAKKEDGAKSEPKDGASKAPGSGRGGPGGGAGQVQGVDWSSIRPRFNWKELLARLVRSSDTTEVTYQKVHRRNITSVHVATATGAGVVRPGEKEVPANLVKLCIVIDSSGSMYEAIKTVFANINKLFMENASAIDKQFALVEFSNTHHIYACTSNGKTGTATEIQSVAGMKGGGSGGRIDLSELLARHQGGGTDFDASLVATLSSFAAQKYNVLILTDSDIVSGSNRTNFLKLYAEHHKQVYMLLDSKETFATVVGSLKQASANISHL